MPTEFNAGFLYMYPCQPPWNTIVLWGQKGTSFGTNILKLAYKFHFCCLAFGTHTHTNTHMHTQARRQGSYSEMIAVIPQTQVHHLGRKF